MTQVANDIEPTSIYLERRTQEYWAISKVFFAGVGVPLTTTKAIHACNSTIDGLGPQRALRGRVEFLQGRIIQGRGKRRKTSLHENVVTLLKATTK